MNMTRTFRLLGLPLALAVAGLAVPAQAQMHDHHGPGWQGNVGDAWRLTPARNREIRQDIDSLRDAIDRAAARRTISYREARGLRDDARSVQQLYRRYARNGLSRGEVRTLEDRVNRVRVALRMERRDWDGYRD